MSKRISFDVTWQQVKLWLGFNKPEHIPSPDCWCVPTLYYVDPDTGQKCYMHKSDEELNN